MRAGRNNRRGLSRGAPSAENMRQRSVSVGVLSRMIKLQLLQIKIRAAMQSAHSGLSGAGTMRHMHALSCLQYMCARAGSVRARAGNVVCEPIVKNCLGTFLTAEDLDSPYSTGKLLPRRAHEP